MTAMRQIHVGAQRGDGDGCRRYMPLEMQFDTRQDILTTEIEETWEESVRAQWIANRLSIRTGLIHQYGNADHERKIEDFIAMRSAPWSIIDEHNLFLGQIRDSFAFGSYYPALVGACTLGERLLNELVLRLRGDYDDHPATSKVKGSQGFSNWNRCIEALINWTVFDEKTATEFNELSKLRHKSVHFGKHLSGVDGREDALNALRLLQSVVGALFRPLGGPPRFIEGTPGRPFLSLASENEPLIRRFYLPSCVLVSPHHKMEPINFDGGMRFAVFDDDSYQEEFPELSDDEFANHLRESKRS
jgi:hypothetical protein